MGNTGYAFQIEEKMQGFFLGMPSRHTAGNWAEALLGTGQKHCWELGRSTCEWQLFLTFHFFIL